MAESLGSAVLTLLTNDRQLDEGLDRARTKVEASADNFRRVGARMQDVGAKLSLAITGPIAGAGAAILANAHSIAEAVPEIENFARLSGVATDEFQRLAFASKSVGIEGDKLSDIYKDMQDRVGDFLTTGGGPMKDFFDTIAPKVGVTAEQFRKLSGPDALQLFYRSLERAGLSQSEMTFFMEAMASDATALIPLLRENGRAFDELGKKAAVIKPEQIAQFKAYNAAQLQMEQATQKLTIAIVSSGLLEGITSVVTKVADFTTELSKTNPELLQTGVAIAALLAAIGPVVMVLGSLTSGLGSLMGMLAAGSGLRVGLAAMSVALGGPVGIAVLAAAVVVAFANWEKIGPWIDNVSTRVTAFQTKFDADAKRFQDGIDAIDRRLGMPTKDEMFRFIERNFNESIARIDAWLASVQSAASRFDAAVVDMANSTVAAARRMYSGVKEWLQDKLGGIFDWFNSKIKAIKETVAGFGNDAGSFFGLVGAVGPGGIIIDDGSGDPPAGDTPPFDLPETPTGTLPDGTMTDEAEGSWREGFRRTFGEGVRAAMNGDLEGFLARWLEDGAVKGLEKAFDILGGLLDDLLGGIGGGGGEGGGIGSMLSGLFAGGFATGGLIPSGKFGIVGERGPELAIASPSGALIRPNASLSNMSLQPGGSSPSVSIPISIDATGADPAALGRVRDELRTLRAELPSQIVKTVQDAGERRIINPGTWR